MYNTLLLYLKYQLGYLCYLLMLFVLPLGLFLQFSPYQLPKVQYVVLAVLYVSQFVLFKEKNFHRKIHKNVKTALGRELGRVPSEQEVFARVLQVTKLRGASIVLTVLGIIGLMVKFQQF